jgi:AcrR family transcriptional regulator
VQTTRDKVVKAAAALLDRGGIEAVTLRDVGRLAGVSHNAPYKHFDDKAALLAAIATRELDVLARQMTAARRRASTNKTAVLAVAVAYVRWAARHPMRFMLTFGHWEGEHDELGRAAREATVAMLDTFRAAASSGDLVLPAEIAAAMVWSLGHGAVDLHLTGHLSKGDTTLRPEMLVERLVPLLFNATPASPATEGSRLRPSPSGRKRSIRRSTRG